MGQDVNPNKINERQERRAEHLQDNLEKKGMGRDEAHNRAMEEVAKEHNSGGNLGGNDPGKGANHQGDHRRGSDKLPG